MPQPPRPLDPSESAAAWFGAEVRFRRQQLRLTLDEVGRRTHVSGDLIGKIEKAERICKPDLVPLLDSALAGDGVFERMLPLLQAEGDRGTRKTQGNPAVGPAAPGVAPAAGFSSDALPGLRRALAFDETATGSTADHSPWEEPLIIAQRAQQAAAVNVDDMTLVALRSSIDDIVERYEHEGPQTLVTATIRLRRYLQQLMDGPQLPRHRRELYLLAAMASGLSGYMAVNAGRLTTARAYCAEAFQLASAVDDRDLMAWVRGTQSLEAYYGGRYAEAHDRAMAGHEIAPHSAQSIRLLVNGSARALGKLGDRVAAERAIGLALDLADRVHAPAGLTSCIAFTPYGQARTLANAATVHLSLNDVPKVLAYADQVDAYIEAADSAWSRALVRLDVATALLHQANPQVEQAMSLGRAALKLCSDRPIRSVVQRAYELQRRAAEWRDVAEVGEYAEVLAAWRAKPASYVRCEQLPAAG